MRTVEIVRGSLSIIKVVYKLDSVEVEHHIIVDDYGNRDKFVEVIMDWLDKDDQR